MGMHRASQPETAMFSRWLGEDASGDVMGMARGNTQWRRQRKGRC
jgi:hypothetical protein